MRIEKIIWSASPEDTAWAAGYFEGEGCIYTYMNGRVAGTRGGPYVRLTLCNTDLDSLQRFADIVGCGIVAEHSYYGKTRLDGKPYKRAQIWRSYKPQDNGVILLAFMPWLGQRRRTKANEAISIIESRPRFKYE
jgi:hypothetical protein